MVEATCIDIDKRQSAAAQEEDPVKRIQLKNDQWQSLIALHKQLLHEHHDFFLASELLVGLTSATVITRQWLVRLARLGQQFAVGDLCRQFDELAVQNFQKSFH
jgi:hypothetical protein